MSILIKGLIMPSCCDGCTFSDWSNLHQTACCKLHDYDPCFSDHSREYTDKRADFCPLVEIPEPHGRLIDADRVTAESIKMTGKRLLAIDTAPTVIEAEWSENHDAD